MKKSKKLTPEEIEFNKKLSMTLIVGGVIFIIVYAFYVIYFFFIHDQGLVPKSDAWGQFGDFIGGVLNPIIAGLAFYLLFHSIKIQSRELGATTEALSESAKEQKEQSEATKKQNKLLSVQMRLEFMYRQYDQLAQERINLIQMGGGGQRTLVEEGYYKKGGGKLQHSQALSVVNGMLNQSIENINIALTDLETISGNALPNNKYEYPYLRPHGLIEV